MENTLCLVFSIIAVCSAFRYETLKGDSGGSDIGLFRFEENGLEKCMAKCDEHRDCVGFSYRNPHQDPAYENCYIKNLVSYPADASIGSPEQNLRTGYRLPNRSCLLPVVYGESAWRTPVRDYSNARECFNAGYCWSWSGCYECAACYTLDKPWLFNVARGKPATQSATSARLGAELAVDGNTDGGLHITNGRHLDTCTLTGHGSQYPWWRVDLEKTYEIHSVVLYNRRGAKQERLQKFQIYAGSTTDVNTNTLCWKEDGQVIYSKQFKCHPKPITGRYLSIKKDGLNYDQYPLTLCEVVIVGGLPRIPNKPTMISRSEDSITVSWQKYQYSSDTEISKYIVIYRPRGEGTRQKINVSRSPTEYTLTGLSKNTEYNISVIVVMKDATEGLPSEYSLIRTCGFLPPPPEWDDTDLSSKLSKNEAYPSIAQITVRWKAPTPVYVECNKVQSYTIRYWNSSLMKESRDTTKSNIKSLVIPDLKAYTDYTVEILVRDTRGAITNNTDPRAVKTAEGRPGFIKSIENTTHSDSITLRLGEPREKNADKIMYNAQVSFSYKILCGSSMANPDHWQNKSNAHSSELSFSKLQSYSVYKVTAWVTTSAGAGPVLEKLAYTKPGVPMGPPVNIKIREQTTTSLIYSWKPHDCQHWNAPLGGTKYQYKLWSGSSRGGEQRTSWMDITVPVVNFTRLEQLTGYNFRVRAVNQQGPSVPSEVIKAKTEESVPGPPAELSVKTKNSTCLVLDWEAPDRANGKITGYKVECTVAQGDTGYTHDLAADVYLYSMTRLTPQTAYTCHVKARTKKGYGAELKKTFWTLGAPKHPTILGATDSSITIQLERLTEDSNILYLILVKQNLATVKRATTDELADILNAPSYNQSRGNKPYLTAKLRGKDLGQPFTVGDGNMYGGVYNGPLTKGKAYSVIYGALDMNGSLATDFTQTIAIKALEDLQKWITPVVVVVVLVILVIIIVTVIVLWKKKIIRKQNTVIEENVDTNIYENITQTVSSISADESETEAVMHMSDRTNKNTLIGTKDVGIPSTSNDKNTHVDSDVALVTRDLNIDRRSLEMIECLGSGRIADVWLADYVVDPIFKVDSKHVAVKLPRERITRKERNLFMNELDAIKRIPRHPNIIAFIGTCGKKDSLSVVMEFASNGNLKGYLNDQRTNVHGTHPLTSKNLIIFAMEIACGMDHVTKLDMLHYNLSARKILLGENCTCKISDIGKATDVRERTLQLKSALAPLPLRWMAIECIEKDEYTTMSNVWSFGVLLWEIITLGEVPYPGKKEMEILAAVKEGYRLPHPPYCDGHLYSLMESCWAVNPTDRPTFLTLCQELEGLLHTNAEYVRIGEINEHVYESLKI